MIETLRRSVIRAFSDMETRNHNEEMEEQYFTDNQRIIRLLSENDGKMWQSDMIKEMNWSSSKMSRMLSAVEEKEVIVRTQIGREKLVTLPEQAPFGPASTSGQPNQIGNFSQ